MDRGRAEAHLRQLAEAELRRATAPGALGLGHSGRLPLVAYALIAVGAVDVGTADEIRAELDLALAVQRPGVGSAAPVRPLRAVIAAFTASRQSPGGWCHSPGIRSVTATSAASWPSGIPADRERRPFTMAY
jgi:hypothetical protein